ncbi:hypothetical protein [Streptomyces achromogenes]|uniref:hypothetical protein n=1 Tax=Streptomyces achromogenes TaxID=67255 RepID=UPI0036FC46BE
MAVDVFWTPLRGVGPEGDRMLALTVGADGVFSCSVYTVRTMGTRFDEVRLAVAVGKRDLLAGQPGWQRVRLCVVV